MKRVFQVLCAVILLSLLLAGCYGRRLVNVPNTVEQTRTDVDELRRNQEETLRLLRQLEARLDENSAFLRELRADTGSLFDETIQRIQVLEGKTDESAYRFERLSDKVDEVRYSPPPTVDSLGTGGDTLAVGFAEARRAYTNAYTDMSTGNYDLALMGFEEFLRNFPDSELSDNAQYWIGECYYAREQYPEAYEAFKKVLDVYPQGDKVPSALLKAGYCASALSQRDEARAYLTAVVERFPLSDEARLAEERLGSLPR